MDGTVAPRAIKWHDPERECDGNTNVMDGIRRWTGGTTSDARNDYFSMFYAASSDYTQYIYSMGPVQF